MSNNQNFDASQNLFHDLRKLLLAGINTTQEALVAAMQAQGHAVNQSKISRLLRKLGAIKYQDVDGKMVYCLPHDTTPPPPDSRLADLVLEIVANETLIVIKTSPGSASIIARIIDFKKCDVLATIAGDDAIFVAPKSIHNIEQSMRLIKQYLIVHNT
jgi:transcriptional regulator of arginine metabolism